MKIAFICIAGAAFLLLFLLGCMRQIHFRIGSRHLKVLLFGITLRRVALANIAGASKREPRGIAERWYSTLKTSHRLLTIQKKSGIVKNFCITPQNRYVFLADLKKAVRRIDPNAEWAALRTQDEPANPGDPQFGTDASPAGKSPAVLAPASQQSADAG